MEEYTKLLREAESTNLSRVMKSGCVAIGKDNQGIPVVSFIPLIGFDYSDSSNHNDTLRQMYLLFIKESHAVVSSGHFSLVYSRNSTDWRKPLIYDFYKILPEKSKKNLKHLYVINPRMGIRLFFSIARVFISADLYKKLVFVENIADFQRIIPPKLLILPYNFLNSEDAERGVKCSGVSVPITLDYVPEYGTTSIMKRCTKFLRNSGALKRQGLFRVAGNENQLSLVRVRLQPPIYFTKVQMRAYMNSIVVGLEDEDFRSNRPPLNKSDDVSFNLPTVVITDIESVAQTLKLSLRDMPEPLFTFKAFDVLMRVTQILDRKMSTIEKWYEEAAAVIHAMPVEHRNTLCYLLDFLREVAAESEFNQMDIHNLSTIFAPTLLRPAKPDFTNPAKAFNEVRLCQLVIKFLLERSIAGVSTLSDRNFSEAIFGVGGGGTISFDAAGGSETAIQTNLNSKIKNRAVTVHQTRAIVSDETATSSIHTTLTPSTVDDSDLAKSLPREKSIIKRRDSDTSIVRLSVNMNLDLQSRVCESAS